MFTILVRWERLGVSLFLFLFELEKCQTDELALLCTGTLLLSLLKLMSELELLCARIWRRVPVHSAQTVFVLWSPAEIVGTVLMTQSSPLISHITRSTCPRLELWLAIIPSVNFRFLFRWKETYWFIITGSLLVFPRQGCCSKTNRLCCSLCTAIQTIHFKSFGYGRFVIVVMILWAMFIQGGEGSIPTLNMILSR